MSTKIREEQLDTITGTDSDTFQLNSGATIKNSSGAMKLCGSTVYAKNADDSDYANFRSRSLRVEMDYAVQCPNIASQSGTTAVWVTVDSMTSLYKSSSSSRRYKDNIEDFTFDIDKFLSLGLKQFNYKKGYLAQDTDNKSIGLIAEEVDEAGFESLVFKINKKVLSEKREAQFMTEEEKKKEDKEILIESVDYNSLPLYLFGVCKELYSRIQKLENNMKNIK